MNNSFLLLILLVVFFSCDSNEKYLGNWVYSLTSENSYDAPSEVIMTNDSIKFRYLYFQFWNNYSYEIKDSKILFNGNTFDIARNKDTLIFNNHLKFIKISNAAIKNELEIEASKMEINLPRFKDSSFQNSNNLKDNIYIRFGKRHDNKEYALQLNDTYYETFELIRFISSINMSKRDELHTFYDYYFFIDKDSQMKDVEKLLLSMAASNETRIFFVNDIDISIQRMDLDFYKINYLSKMISAIVQEDYFNDKIGFTGAPRPPLPPLPPPPPYENDNSPIVYLLLLKNGVYYENNRIDISEIEHLIQESIAKNKIIFSLYDLQSNYGSFLELNAAIHSAYLNARKVKSQIDYGKDLYQLDENERDSIKTEIPMKHIWSYSIPHYNSILKENNTLFGLKAKTVDSTFLKLHN
ncbi:MAG: hypothetical protein ACSHXF_02240 [Aquaticitalea sp.]